MPNTVSDKQQQPTPHNLVPHTSCSHVEFYACYQFGGMLFSRHSTHTGNSLVMFFPSGSGTLISGCIKYIFQDNSQI
ncbi:hypothetical protein J3R82DRAFT_6995 [Butyriboletus roseoflavus]|nr:hypothetical protein J3R82DRAFT_6995 [Butyriboletus roseoflavus]